MAKRATARSATAGPKTPRPEPTRDKATTMARTGPDPEAMLLFQRGMEAIQRHAYLDATPAFQAVLMGFPGEPALLERARVYLELCERETRRKPAAPKTIEERLTAATAALNNAHDGQAEELARSVLGDDPKQDLALYLLAAVHARRGAKDDALALLGKVIAQSPEAAAQARRDADFAALHNEDAFWKLIEPPIVSTGRARRRSRGERLG